MKRTLIGLIIGIVIGFILAEVISPPYQVSVSSLNLRECVGIKINRWTGTTWALLWSKERNLQSGKQGYYYWEEIQK